MEASVTQSAGGDRRAMRRGSRGGVTPVTRQRSHRATDSYAAGASCFFTSTWIERGVAPSFFGRCTSSRRELSR
jgi:hypothetical protein